MSLVVYRLVHAPVILRGTRESGVRLPARERIVVDQYFCLNFEHNFLLLALFSLVAQESRLK